ncbi:MAG TPA: hypothetical protein VFT98_05775 [Myxococcota bacterium]|nr:hypothetical protein [Myxococcota bacterium]
MRAHAIAALVIGLAVASHAQTPSGGAQPQQPLQILVYTPQGQPMALTLVPAAPPAAPSPLRKLIEETPDRVVVIRHTPQPAIPLTGGGSLEIESLGVFEPGYEEQRLFGIRIVVNRDELPANERTFYFEPRDVDPLVRALDLIETIAGTPSPHATDAEFHMAEGFGFGLRSANGKSERIVRASRGELVRFGLAADGLARLRSALEAARAGIFGS